MEEELPLRSKPGARGLTTPCASLPLILSLCSRVSFFLFLFSLPFLFQLFIFVQAKSIPLMGAGGSW
jgi:hypothetical protein